MIKDELQHWIEKSLNNIANEEELRALEDSLLGDAQALDHYLNAVNVHASLRRRFSVAKEHPSFTWRKFSFGLAIAASVAVIIGVSMLLLNTSTPTAVSAHVVGAYDEAGAAYKVGETVEQGPVIVSRGLVRLDFSNGVRVTIEGPAQIEVKDEKRLVLHHGVVAATIPESVVGFEVDTPLVHVADLGTSFGVSVSEAGLTDVSVFDGEVEVSSIEFDGEVASRLVREGQAIRASEATRAIDSVAYKTSRFENAWPMNSGVLQTTGSMRFVPPGPDFHPGNYEDSEHIVVFPERRGLVLDKTIRVDLVDPGEYVKSPYLKKPTLPTGRRLTSYLLQLDATWDRDLSSAFLLSSYPEGKNPNRKRSVRGQITFAKPIVGVVTGDLLLKESEAVFGIPDVRHPTARTIEPRPEGDPRQGFDKLILAADRRTLLIELRVSPEKLDQIRVLVEAE